jgi:hypothetical protein
MRGVAMKKPKKPMIVTSTSSGNLPPQDLIGRKLRELYEDAVKQPVPDRFIALLDELEEKSKEKKSS